MDRKVHDTLLKWKSSSGRALVLEGPRQTGKTFIMKEFSKSYHYSVYIDLEENEELKTVFEQTDDTSEIYEKLSYNGIRFDTSSGDPLFIIDGLQSCPRAFSALKPLAVDGRCDMIASVSLPGVEPSEGDFPSPIGYVQMVEMGPMDFEEFLWAMGIGKELTAKIRQWIDTGSEIDVSIGSALTRYFRKFMTVGGMPAAVQKYVDTKDYNEVWVVLASICNIIEKDALRYSDKKDRLKILACLESIPSQLAGENKTFVYKDVGKQAGTGRREYGSSLDWLHRAGLINLCYNLRDPCEPLSQMERTDSFKVYLKDPGILTYMLGRETASAIESGNTYVNEGAVVESCISQALVSNGYRIHFYSKPNSSLKMDFVISYKGRLTALETRSGKTKISRSLLMLTSGDYKVERGIKIADGPVGADGHGILHLPLFAPCFFDIPRIETAPSRTPRK